MSTNNLTQTPFTIAHNCLTEVFPSFYNEDNTQSNNKLSTNDISRYTIIKRLRETETEVEYLTIDTRANNQLKTIKTMLPLYSNNKMAIATFKADALIAKTLKHPHISQTYQYIHNDSKTNPYTITEHLSGVPLRTHLKHTNGAPLLHSVISIILNQASQALYNCYQLNYPIAHNHLSIDTIYYDEATCNIKITGFKTNSNKPLHQQYMLDIKSLASVFCLCLTGKSKTNESNFCLSKTMLLNPRLHPYKTQLSKVILNRYRNIIEFTNDILTTLNSNHQNQNPQININHATYHCIYCGIPLNINEYENKDLCISLNNNTRHCIYCGTKLTI